LIIKNIILIVFNSFNILISRIKINILIYFKKTKMHNKSGEHDIHPPKWPSSKGARNSCEVHNSCLTFQWQFLCFFFKAKDIIHWIKA
jgi:hypothetical protein